MSGKGPGGANGRPFELDPTEDNPLGLSIAAQHVYDFIGFDLFNEVWSHLPEQANAGNDSNGWPKSQGQLPFKKGGADFILTVESETESLVVPGSEGSWNYFRSGVVLDISPAHVGP